MAVENAGPQEIDIWQIRSLWILKLVLVSIHTLILGEALVLFILGIRMNTLFIFLDYFGMYSIVLMFLGIFLTVIVIFAFGAIRSMTGIIPRTYIAILLLCSCTILAIGVNTNSLTIRETLENIVPKKWPTSAKSFTTSIQESFQCCYWSVSSDVVRPQNCAFKTACRPLIIDSLHFFTPPIAISAILIGSLSFIAIIACIFAIHFFSRPFADKSKFQMNAPSVWLENFKIGRNYGQMDF